MKATKGHSLLAGNFSQLSCHAELVSASMPLLHVWILKQVQDDEKLPVG
jgi:hypothetical protein